MRGKQKPQDTGLAKSTVTDSSDLAYELLFEMNPLPLWILEGSTQRVIAVNDSALGQYGYARKEFLKLPLSRLSVNGHFPKLSPRQDWDPQQKEFLYAGTWQHRKKNGEVIEVDLRWLPITIDGKNLKLVLARDVTERKVSQEQIREREEKLRFLVQQMPATLWSVDSDLRVTSSLGGGISLLNSQPDELTGVSLADYLKNNEAASFAIAAHRRALRGESVTFEGNWDGHTFQVRIDPLRGANNNITGCVGVSLDVTERKLSEEALRESKERYRRLVDLSPDAIIVHSDGRIVYINQAALKLLGAGTAEQIIGRRFQDFVHPDSLHTVKDRHRKMMEEGKDAPLIEEKFVRLDGAVIDVEVAAIPFIYHEKPAIQAVVRDITERKRSEIALRQSEERYRAFVEQSSEAIWRFEVEKPISVHLPENEQIDLFYRFAYLAECNDVMAKMYGFERAEELTGARLGDFLVRTEPKNTDYLRAFIRSSYRLVDAESHEVDKYGETRYFSNNLVGIVEDGELVRAWGSQRDISERKQAEEMIRHLAYHDPLSGLPNRMLFQDRFGQALAVAHRNNEMLAMLFLDLDRFKTINDTLGHAVGDMLLKGVSQRLELCLREGDTLARLGGDEFMILICGLQNLEEAAKLAERLLQAVRPSFHFENQELHITTSIGISLYPYDGKDADTLIKNADIALYRAKEHGRDNYQMYTPAMNERAFEKLSLENSLRRALERQEFVLHYQPQVSLRTGRIMGAEALLRWRRPGGEFLSPMDFISMAEDTGLIVPLGEWVLRAACSQNKLWQLAGLPPLHVGVNLSARQFQQQSLIRAVSRILEETGLDPRYLDLELTESAVMKNSEAATETLKELKSKGIQISIDDFGTGYSSLSRLKRFPITALKIDQSFVRDCMTDPDDATIVAAIISLAHSLKIRVVAEGVETEGQLEFLRSLKCDAAQGSLVGEPLTADQFTEMMLGKSQRSAWKLTPLPAAEKP
jgi:diguanylate cyclase (GGDEF)-like protein/PAS domain S-box-containing protein